MILKGADPGLAPDSFGEVHPRYAGQSLPNVIGTVASALGVGSACAPIDPALYKGRVDMRGIKKVVLIVLDGLGYDMLLDSGYSQGFFGRMAKGGLVMPITTVFPSTTAAALTTVNTGLTPLEHGLPEWVVYMKEAGMIINTIPFTKYVSESRVSLSSLGIDPKILYDGETVYERFSREGIRCHTLMGRNLAESAYNRLVKKGSEFHTYVYPTDAAIKLRRVIESEGGPAYINMYIDSIDSSSHAYGPLGEESRGEIDTVSAILKSQLLDKVDGRVAKDTLVMFTADHGHTRIDPREAIYLNGDRRLMRLLDSDESGKILPTGSPRGVFLHIEEGKVEEARSYLESRFAGEAHVITTDEALSMGLFGQGRQHRKLADRIGDVIVLPRDGRAIWYEHVKGRKLKMAGVHGGLSRGEMLVPLGMARLSDLI